ncbi:MAG: hypothetical protein QHH27_03065 [Clostridia bacterium]|jgi:tetratricopeptide (TPR) repeat protein|nr:hypothetical protein [Clostridia bacterium]MDH7572517.1 hypothetical protein [Clostridia bacterium]
MQTEVLDRLRERMAAQLSWLKSCQIVRPGTDADGAIALRPGSGRVNPYFANFAALALLEDPLGFPAVERYLEWYRRHLREDGTIPDYHYQPDRPPRPSAPDSEDAYAGTYLSLVARFRRRTGRTTWVSAHLPALKQVARAIVRLMDRDGLTFARADHRVKYLMDNCEAYRGLEDFAQALDLLGDGEAAYFRLWAQEIACGVEKSLWDRRRGCYRPAKAAWFARRANLRRFYPDAACQLFPALYGLIPADSRRAARLYARFNRYHPGWVGLKPPNHPWVLLAYCACLHGDYGRALEKLNRAWEAYVVPRAERWYCAEAAFFVLAAACLLRAQDPAATPVPCSTPGMAPAWLPHDIA